MSVKVGAYRTRDSVPGPESEEEDGELEAPEDKKWVDVQVSIRSHNSRQTFSYHQWALEDFQAVRVGPDAEAMRKARGTMPDQVELRGGTLEEYTIYFAVEYTSDLTFIVEPYRNAAGPTVVIET